jgi:hypothetical protein
LPSARHFRELTGARRKSGWPGFAVFRVFSKDFAARMTTMKKECSASSKRFLEQALI